MKGSTRHTRQHQRLSARARCSSARCGLARVALGLALLGAAVALSGCDSLMGDDTGAPASRGQKSTYIDRKVGPTYEGIALHPDGTYDRTVVDNWGRSHQQQGTWRGYGGTSQLGKNRVSRRLELDGYSDTRDVIGAANAQNAPKSTKRLYSGDFYSH